MASREWWTIEFDRMTTFDGVEAKTITEVLDTVARFRDLDDPAFNPVAIIKHVQTVTETQERTPIGIDVDAVVKDVRRKFVEARGEMQGEAALDWAVRSTIDSVREKGVG